MILGFRESRTPRAHPRTRRDSNCQIPGAKRFKDAGYATLAPRDRGKASLGLGTLQILYTGFVARNTLPCTRSGGRSEKSLFLAGNSGEHWHPGICFRPWPHDPCCTELVLPGVGVGAPRRFRLYQPGWGNACRSYSFCRCAMTAGRTAVHTSVEMR
ncbi:hypothetical protein BC628DRAFT_797705 [Trametes gibbosa]|nr:hypothetical protein BC628DRAFT_797705 [Trametes gibbosa]